MPLTPDGPSAPSPSTSRLSPRPSLSKPSLTASEWVWLRLSSLRLLLRPPMRNVLLISAWFARDSYRPGF